MSFLLRRRSANKPSKPSLEPSPVAKGAIFLSHAQKDGGDQVHRIFLELNARGLEVWFDMNAEEVNKEAMKRGVASADTFVMFLTQGYAESWFCAMEFSHALRLGKKIVVVQEADLRLGGVTELQPLLDDIVRMMNSSDELRVEGVDGEKVGVAFGAPHNSLSLLSPLSPLAHRMLVIDLGTTRVRAGVYGAGSSSFTLLDFNGAPFLDSIAAISATSGEIHFPLDAAAQMQGTISIGGIKRLIGRNLTHPAVEEYSRAAALNVRDEDEGLAIIVLDSEPTRDQIVPVTRLLIVMLSYVKHSVLAHVGELNSLSAVVSVPATFDGAQCRTVLRAFDAADISVASLIKDSAAELFIYSLSIAAPFGERTVLLFSLGGGCFQIDLARVSAETVQILVSRGSCTLGGWDFDTRVCGHFEAQFLNVYNKQLGAKEKLRLREATERARRDLSTTTTAFLEVDSLFSGVDYTAPLTRKQFEEICLPQFEAIREAMSEVAQQQHGHIDEILTFGGASRTPKIRSMLAEMFPGVAVNSQLEVEEAVVRGAAIAAKWIVEGKRRGETEVEAFLERNTWKVFR